MSESSNPSKLTEHKTKLIQQVGAISLRPSKTVVTLFALILILITISGSSALLSSPIHPIALVLGILIPAYLFLIFALIRKHSLFSDLLLLLQKQISKLQHHLQNGKSASTNHKTTPTLSAADSAQLMRLMKSIMHFSWLMIFLALIISFFFQFTLKQYQFHLYSTLFPQENGLYYQIIAILDYLPNFFHQSLITPEIIEHSLNNDPSAIENAAWAKWVILMILYYGLIPRLIFFLFSYLPYRRHRQITPPTVASVTQTITHIVDPAKARPQTLRPAKTITFGEHQMEVALDYAYPLSPQIKIINDRKAFNALQQALEQAPLAHLTLYIDSELTPDRSLLRRIYTLLNLSLNNEIILIEGSDHSRIQEWQTKLQPNLYENEILRIHHKPQ